MYALSSTISCDSQSNYFCTWNAADYMYTVGSHWLHASGMALINSQKIMRLKDKDRSLVLLKYQKSAALSVVSSWGKDHLDRFHWGVDISHVVLANEYPPIIVVPNRLLGLLKLTFVRTLQTLPIFFSPQSCTLVSSLSCRTYSKHNLTKSCPSCAICACEASLGTAAETVSAQPQHCVWVHDLCTSCLQHFLQHCFQVQRKRCIFLTFDIATGFYASHL